MAELASRYQVHPNMIAKWKREALDGVKETFQRGKNPADRNHEDGNQTATGQDRGTCGGAGFFGRSLRSMNADRRRRMIRGRNRRLSVGATVRVGRNESVELVLPATRRE